MIPIKGFPKYGYENGKVWSLKMKKPLSVAKIGTGFVNLYRDKQHHLYSVAKIAFCAQHGIDPDVVPKRTLFTLNEDGSVSVGDWSERTKKRKSTDAKFKAASVERINSEIRWLQLQKSLLQGNDTKSEILIFLTNTADEVKPYLIKATRRSATIIEDALLEAVDKCYETIMDKKYLVQSPRRWLTFAVRKILKENRKSYQFNDNINRKEQYQ